MTIERDGKKIELTHSELVEAYDIIMLENVYEDVKYFVYEYASYNGKLNHRKEIIDDVVNEIAHREYTPYWNPDAMQELVAVTAKKYEKEN